MPTCLTARRYDHGRKILFPIDLTAAAIQEGKIQPISSDASANLETVLVDFALQGGGSHGAFTWGVLDRLLEETWQRIDGISGTSAGAMNAVVLVDGYEKDGPRGAQAALEGFWRRVSHSARFSPIRRSPLDVLFGRWTLDTSPFFVAFDLAARLFSPYDLNPHGANPLREVLAECVDFGRVANSSIRLFVTATNVRTGRGRVFRNKTDTAVQEARPVPQRLRNAKPACRLLCARRNSAAVGVLSGSRRCFECAGIRQTP